MTQTISAWASGGSAAPDRFRYFERADGTYDMVAQLLKLILTVLLGYIAFRKGWVDRRGLSSISGVLVNIGYPALILLSFWTLDFRAYLATGARILLVGLIANILLFALGKIWFRGPSRRQNALRNFMLSQGNITYVGLPILAGLVGDGGVLTAVIYGSVGDLFIWTLHYPGVKPAGDKSRWSVVLNPTILCLVLGIGFSVVGLPVPQWVSETGGPLQSMVTPLALLYLGASLAQYPIKNALKNRRAMLFSLVKVLLIPALSFVGLFFLFDLETAAVMATIIGCPTTILSIIWAGGTEDYADVLDTFLVSTAMFMAVYIPLLMMLRSV